MNRNVRIAKELVKIAKSLVAQNELEAGDGALDDAITIGSDKTSADGAFDSAIVVGSVRTAYDYYNDVEDSETRQRRYERNEKERNLKNNALDAFDMTQALTNKAKEELISKGRSGIGLSSASMETYMEGKEDKYGKIKLSMTARCKQDGENVVITIESRVSNGNNESEVFDTSKITLRPGTYSCKLKAESIRSIAITGNNEKQTQEFVNDAYKHIIYSIDSSSVKLKDRLYKMNTPWIKRLFGIGK